MAYTKRTSQNSKKKIENTKAVKKKAAKATTSVEDTAKNTTPEIDTPKEELISKNGGLNDPEKTQQEKNDQAVTMVRGYLVQTLALFVRATATVLRKYNVSDEFIKAIMDEATVELHRISEQDKKTSEGN